MYQEQAYPSSSLGSGARRNFVKKVYSVLSIQLLATVFMVWCNFSFRAFAKFQERNTWLFWVAFVAALVSMISLCTFTLIQSLAGSARTSLWTSPYWECSPSRNRTWFQLSARCTQPAVSSSLQLPPSRLLLDSPTTQSPLLKIIRHIALLQKVPIHPFRADLLDQLGCNHHLPCQFAVHKEQLVGDGRGFPAFDRIQCLSDGRHPDDPWWKEQRIGTWWLRVGVCHPLRWYHQFVPQDPTDSRQEERRLMIHPSSITHLYISVFIIKLAPISCRKLSLDVILWACKLS